MKKYVSAVFLIFIFIFSSCVNQRPAYIPQADSSYFEIKKTVDVDINNITGTKENSSARDALFLPEWLTAFFNGGIEAVEAIDMYNDKYIYIAVHESGNFTALNIWAERFSVHQDFSMLAGARIEQRMISSASIYPDYEYGLFFERLVKNAYTGDFPGMVKEDIYWIKIRKKNPDSANEGETAESEIFMFFILLSIDKPAMQNAVGEMMEKTLKEVTPTREQAAAINRLRQNFFIGF